MEKIKPKFRPYDKEVIAINQVDSGELLEVFLRGQNRKSYRARALARVETSQYGNPTVLVEGVGGGLRKRHWLGAGTSVSIIK